MLAKQTDTVFADLAGNEPGVPDGMKIDLAGNVYCGGSGGLYILNAQGKKLGRIVHGHPATTNIAFGGDDWKTLYFTSRSSPFTDNLSVKRRLDARVEHFNGQTEASHRVPVGVTADGPEVEARIAPGTSSRDDVLGHGAAVVAEQAAIDDRVVVADLRVGPEHRGG